MNAQPQPDGWTQIYAADGQIPPPEPRLTVAERREAEDPELVRSWAEEYVASGDAQAACRAVRWFDTRYSLKVWARRVLERPDVQMEILLARASGVTERRVEEHSREAVVQDLDEIREGAVMDGAWSAATGAVTTKARVLGYLDTTVNIRVTSARELSLEDLRRQVALLPAPDTAGALGAPIDADYTEVTDA